MDISQWYKFNNNEWYNDWNNNEYHSKLIRTSPYGGLIAILTFGEGVSRKLRIFSGTGTLLMSIQWVVKWMLDAGWTYTLQFVTLLSNGTVRVCTLNAKRRQQFTLPFRPIAGKVFQDGFLLFESNGNVHFVSYHNIECLTHERLCSLGQLDLIHGEIPLTIVPLRSIYPNHLDIQNSNSIRICFALSTCHKNLIVCKAISNITSSLVYLTKNLGFVVKNGLLDFYKSLIGIIESETLHIYHVDLDKFDDIIYRQSITLGIIPTYIYITTSYIILNTDNQMYIKYYGNGSKLPLTFDSIDNNSMLSNTLLSNDEIYPIGPQLESFIIGFYYTNLTLDANDDHHDDHHEEEGVRIFYPSIGEVWLLRSNMDWYMDIVENNDNSSHRLVEAFKAFSRDCSEAFALKIDFDAIYGCIRAASAALDLSLAELYLEATWFGRRLIGFTRMSNFNQSQSPLNSESDIDRLWASTCGWLRILYTLKSLDLYFTVSEARSIGIERICEMISARGYPKIAFSISKYAKCSPNLAYQQYAISEILSSMHLPDGDLINALNIPMSLPNGVFAKLSKIALSLSRNTLALSLYDRERCIYSKAPLANMIINNVKINQFPTDLIRIMIQNGIQMPLYYRHYYSRDDLKTCQKTFERMGFNGEAGRNATIIGQNYWMNDRIKEAKNWFGYSQSFSKAAKNQLLLQSVDEVMLMMKHGKRGSLMELIFDLFIKGDYNIGLNIGNDLGISKKRLGVTLISSCIIKKDLSTLNKYIKDKRVEIPQHIIQQAYGHVEFDKPETNSFFNLWK